MHSIYSIMHGCDLLQFVEITYWIDYYSIYMIYYNVLPSTCVSTLTNSLDCNIMNII